MSTLTAGPPPEIESTGLHQALTVANIIENQKRQQAIDQRAKVPLSVLLVDEAAASGDALEVELDRAGYAADITRVENATGLQTVIDKAIRSEPAP